MKQRHNPFFVIILIIFCLWRVSTPVWAQAQKVDFSELPAVKVAISDDQSITIERVLYTALKRSGYQMIAEATGMRTAVADVNYGDAAILPVQTDGWERLYPNLIKVPVAIDNVEVSVYTRSHAAYQFSEWNDMAGLKLGYRWQNEDIANNIWRAQASELIRLNDYNELWESLLSGNSDAVILPRLSHFEYRFPPGIKRIGVIQRTPVYSYVNRMYSYLVPLLEKAYNEMIADGTMDLIYNGKKLSVNEVFTDYNKPVILYINSYNAQNEKERIQMDTIREILEEKTALELYSINLNSNEHHSQANFNLIISEMIRTEFIARYPDLIIASGDEAFEYVLSNYYMLFSNVPVLFFGVQRRDDSVLYGFEDKITGIFEEISINETISYMLKSFPETRRIYVLNGYYLSRSNNLRQEIQKSIESEQVDLHGLPVEFVYNEDKTLAEILNDIKDYNSDTLVLIGNYFSDSRGSFYSEAEIQKLVSDASVNPVFCLITSYIGHGPLGGFVSSTNEKSKIAASMACEILAKTPVNQIPVKFNTAFLNQWLFDYKTIKKFNISLKKLPAGYVLINRIMPLWESNPSEFRLLFMIVLLFLLIIFGLILFYFRNSKITQRISRQKELFETVNSVSSILLEPDINRRFEDTLRKAMDIMANAVGVDRVCIWRKNDESRLCLSLNYQWENNYFKSLKENGILTPDIYFDSHPVWNEVLLKGDCINSLVRDMPPAEQAELKHRNILSIFVVPVFLQEEQFWGYIGFDNCKRECIFTNSEVMILRSASRMIAHAIIRSEMTMQLENTAIIANNANKSKSSFLANMSHEIRTPMNAILGIAEIQLRDEILSAETEEAIRKIYESGDLLLNIINDILDLSKIEAGKLELVPIKYDIPSLVNDSVQLNRLRYDSKPIELLIFVDENTPQYLIGDELRIKQVLNNILSNAFKYTDEGTIEFHISAETEQNNNNDNVMINFRIIDTGHGMTAIQIHNLFDEYTRFNAEANRETIGTGLGMSITKHLVDLMKGGITVKSELGKGTEFTVRIPQKRVGSEVCGNELSDKLRNFNFRSTTLTNKTQFLREYMPYGSVLVVDDVESNIYVIKGMLLPYGIKIDAVSSGFDAIKKIEEGNVYDIIFMDHMMPKLDGIETVKKIRGLGYKHTIVALTANALIGRAEMFLQNGFDGFISKPIDSRELNLMLNELIRNKKPAEVIEAVRYFAYKNKGNAAAEAAQKELVSEELIAAAVHDVENAFEVLDDLLLGINLGKVNLDLFTTTVHGIKSAFANIGEKQLSDFALRLEQAGEKRDTTAISIDISGFMYSLQAFLSKHKKSPSKKDDNNQQGVSDDDIVFLKEKLNGIKTACAKFNQKDAKTALNEIKRKIWSQKTSDIINDISLYLIRGEYEKVESAIDEAMNGEI